MEETKAVGPARLKSFAHVSVPCRDLEEGKAFYRDVLGGELHVDQPTFASFRLGGVDVGIGIEGCSWLAQSAEYPHFAFFVGPDELLQMKAWLNQCGVPTSNFWTRRGVEALMFFRDPSGNVIELYCEAGFKGADALPKGPPRGHGTAVDIDVLRYSEWKRPHPAR
ncbi:MAG TPA: VOC family protein [Stellaceae bacterium]|nr:VOC family protein [Stellaceae bacterium]